MAVVTTEKLSKDIQASARALVEGIGLVPQSRDQPLSANDLLFYLNDTSMPMAGFLQENGLFVDGEGLHFDPVRFVTIRAIAETVIRDYQAGNRDGVWKRFDLSEDEDVEGNGTYLLVVQCLTSLRLHRVMFGIELTSRRSLGRPARYRHCGGRRRRRICRPPW